MSIVNRQDASPLRLAGDTARAHEVPREAGLCVAAAEPLVKTMSVQREIPPGAASDGSAPPAVQIVSVPGGAVALQAGEFQILMPASAPAGMLADAARALVRWQGNAASPQAEREQGARSGEISMPSQGAEDALAALCHDLRTPLSVMIGWLHMLQSGKLDAAATQRAIDKLQASIEQQVQLIDRVMSAGGKSPK